MKSRLKKFLAEILPPTPPPVLFEFTGLQNQLTELNTALAELRRIECRREQLEVERRGY